MSDPIDPQAGARAVAKVLRRPTALLGVLGFLISVGGLYVSVKALAELARQIEITDRAWLKVDIKLTGGFTSSEDHHYLPVTLTLKNVGRSVATSIRTSVRLYIPDRRDRTRADDMITPPRLQDEICQFQRRDNPDYGMNNFVLFPEDAHVVRDQAAFNTTEALERGKSVAPILYGCVTYRYPSSRVPHSTRFGFVLSQPFEGDDAGINVRYFPLTSLTAIGADQIVLVPFLRLWSAD